MWISQVLLRLFFAYLSYLVDISKIVAQRSCFRCKSSEGWIGIEEPQENANLLGNSLDSLTAILQTLLFFFFFFLTGKYNLLIRVTCKRMTSYFVIRKY